MKREAPTMRYYASTQELEVLRLHARSSLVSLVTMQARLSGSGPSMDACLGGKEKMFELKSLKDNGLTIHDVVQVPLPGTSKKLGKLVFASDSVRTSSAPVGSRALEKALRPLWRLPRCFRGARSAPLARSRPQSRRKQANCLGHAFVDHHTWSVISHRIFTSKFSGVYPHYVTKAVKNNRTKDEVDQITRWLTGYDQAALEAHLASGTDFQTFFGQAPAMNPNTALIKGVVSGVRAEDVEDPLMPQTRWLDKLVDELAEGQAMILPHQPGE